MASYYNQYERRVPEEYKDFERYLAGNEKHIDVSRLYIEYEGRCNITSHRPYMAGVCPVFYVYYENSLIAKYYAVLKKKDFLSVNSYHQRYKIKSDTRYEMVDAVKAFINKYGGLEKFMNMTLDEINESKVKGKPLFKTETVQNKKEIQKKESKKMESVKKSLSTVKTEALEATKRESVNAAWDVLKNGLIKMGLDGLSEEHANQAKVLLDTKLGDMLLRILVGAALDQVTSSKSSDVRIETLTKELRVQGYQAVIGTYMHPMTIIVNEALKQMNPFATALEDSKEENHQ